MRPVARTPGSMAEAGASGPSQPGVEAGSWYQPLYTSPGCHWSPGLTESSHWRLRTRGQQPWTLQTDVSTKWLCMTLQVSPCVCSPSMKCPSAPLTPGHLMLFFVSAPIEHYWLPLPLFPQSNSTDCYSLTHDDGKKYKSNFLMRIYVTMLHWWFLEKFH